MWNASEEVRNRIEQKTEWLDRKGCKMQKKNYGLFTAITMIAGVVIGSGIFFKSDDILSYTHGNMGLGILIFVVAAIAIIFGCLAMSQLATRTDKPGGLIAYAEEFLNVKISSAFGWFQSFLYFPTLVAVVAWVAGMYLCQLFGMEGTNLNYSLLGFVVIVGLFFINVLSARLGGLFQNASMIIKLIPLLLIGIVGLFFGKPGEIIGQDVEMIRQGTITATWVSAFAPIAFSFDGWIVSTSIGHEIKNSKKNLPIALAFAPLVILFAYVMYFVGVTSLVGTETILEQGNDSVFTAANMVFGHIGAKIILVFVVISVLGTVNGLVLGYIRAPYSLALNQMIPGSTFIKKESKKLNGMPFHSAIVAFVISCVWLVVHHITQEMQMRGDVSEISICVSYLNYIMLYIVVFKMARKGEIKSKFMGYVVPVMAIIGSLVILSGSITHPLFIYYIVICYSIMGAGYWYKAKQGKK